jgi:hypothetical protein
MQATTLVVGVGEVGSALANVLGREQRVERLDLEPRPIAAPVAVMHICFPFVNAQAFEAAVAGYVEQFQPQLTIINSTVRPGTTTALAAHCRQPMVFSPVRGKHAHMEADLLRYRKFVAATTPAAAAAAQAHFAQSGMQTTRIERPQTLELAKLAETSYFGLLIAFAQELNRYAAQLEGDYAQAASFFEEIDFLPRCRYFPGFIGGHCVIPNLNLFQQLRPSALFQAILDSNELRAQELARASANR